MQWNVLCRSRRELSDAYFAAKFGFDTADNEPFQVCPLSAYRSPRLKTEESPEARERVHTVLRHPFRHSLDRTGAAPPSYLATFGPHGTHIGSSYLQSHAEEPVGRAPDEQYGSMFFLTPT